MLLSFPFLTTKLYKCTRAGKLFPNRGSRQLVRFYTRQVSYEIAQAGPEGLHDKYVNSKLIYEPFSPLYSLVSASITKRNVSTAMRMHEMF